MSDIIFNGTGSREESALATVMGRAKALCGSVIALVWLMLARSRERQVLASLDARGLRDIGLTREQAGIEARKRFWQG